MCSQFRDRVLRLGIVGTAPCTRGRGLAKACLNHTLGLSRASGDYDGVEVHVDSASRRGRRACTSAMVSCHQGVCQLPTAREFDLAAV